MARLLTDTPGHNAKGRSNEEAKEIFQEVLDRVSKAVLEYDEATLRDVIILPTRMTTQNAEIVFETVEDWLTLTLRVHRGLASLGVNHYVRLVQSAEFLSDSYIEGVYDTHSLCNAIPMAPAYTNRSTLKLVDGAWKFGMMEAEITNEQFPFTIPRLNNFDRSALRPRVIEDDPRRAGSSPLSIYQSYLNALTEADMAKDFEGWCNLMEFPHGIHRTEVDEWIETPDQLRQYFDWMHVEEDELQPDDVIRKASRAEFISATQICGYHQCHVQRDGKPIKEPVAARHIIKRTGTQWRAVSITNSLKDTQFPYVREDPDKPLISLKEIEERTGRK